MHGFTPQQFEGRYGSKTVSPSTVKLPSLLVDFKLICTARGACAVSASLPLSVTPLQCEETYVTKTVSASYVKFSSLLTDYILTCLACSAFAASATSYLSGTPLLRERRCGRKTVSASRSVPFITARFQPNLLWA